MDRIRIAGLGAAGIVLLALAVCGALRLLNVVLYRIGGIGAIIVILALAYAVFRNRN